MKLSIASLVLNLRSFLFLLSCSIRGLLSRFAMHMGWTDHEYCYDSRIRRLEDSIEVEVLLDEQNSFEFASDFYREDAFDHFKGRLSLSGIQVTNTDGVNKVILTYSRLLKRRGPKPRAFVPSPNAIDAWAHLPPGSLVYEAEASNVESETAEEPAELESFQLASGLEQKAILASPEVSQDQSSARTLAVSDSRPIISEESYEKKVRSLPKELEAMTSLYGNNAKGFVPNEASEHEGAWAQETLEAWEQEKIKSSSPYEYVETDRFDVPGGWLVRSTIKNRQAHIISVSSCFVPHPMAASFPTSA